MPKEFGGTEGHGSFPPQSSRMPRAASLSTHLRDNPQGDLWRRLRTLVTQTGGPPPLSDATQQRGLRHLQNTGSYAVLLSLPV